MAHNLINLAFVFENELRAIGHHMTLAAVPCLIPLSLVRLFCEEGICGGLI
jgi:hypothetical protein